MLSPLTPEISNSKNSIADEYFSESGSLPFRDRTEAGRVLGDMLSRRLNEPNILILALPRGGVPVAFQVALTLGAQLDIFLVRKLGVPGQPELAMGAIASGDLRVLNYDSIGACGVTPEEIESVTAVEKKELRRRAHAYRGDRPSPSVAGRTVVLVDDGLATGSTMRAAAQALRAQEPSKIIAAVPVAAVESCAALRQDVDEVFCAFTPTPFFAVGRWYRDFSPTMDREIRQLLQTPTQKHMVAI